MEEWSAFRLTFRQLWCEVKTNMSSEHPVSVLTRALQQNSEQLAFLSVEATAWVIRISNNLIYFCLFSTHFCLLCNSLI